MLGWNVPGFGDAQMRPRKSHDGADDIYSYHLKNPAAMKAGNHHLTGARCPRSARVTLNMRPIQFSVFWFGILAANGPIPAFVPCRSGHLSRMLESKGIVASTGFQ
jgi:hypothetical protein